MPVICVHRPSSLSVRDGNTLVVDTDFTIPAGGMTIELGGTYNLPGTWTIVTWAGELVGDFENITFVSTGLPAGLSATNYRVDGKSIKVDLITTA